MLAILNINSWEYVIIGVVALMVIGPEQLPSVMRKGGHYLRQFRDTSDKLKDEFMTGVDELDPNKWIEPDPTEPRKLGKAVSPGGPRQVKTVGKGREKVVSSADNNGTGSANTGETDLTDSSSVDPAPEDDEDTQKTSRTTDSDKATQIEGPETKVPEVESNVSTSYDLGGQERPTPEPKLASQTSDPDQTAGPDGADDEASAS